MRIGIVNKGDRETDLLRRAVALKPEHQVIWSAKTGAEGVARCATERADLVLMDVCLSDMDGVEATRQIMAIAPCAILIVTDNVHSHTARVFEAMGQGALDVVEMPDLGPVQLLGNAAPLLSKIVTISRVIGERDASRHGRASDLRSQPLLRQPLIAIGASAGGPAALAVVLRGLPDNFPAAIVIIQHVEAQFAEGMAEWLSQQSAMPVTIAKQGEVLAVGKVVLAGTSDHLMLNAASRLVYSPEPRDYAYRPSVDVFFESVSRLWRGDAVGVLLTGMGKDGALGLKAMRNRGHHTIAQNQASCVVYGMPKAAAAMNAAVDILPMNAIASRLIGLVAGKASPVGLRTVV